jgi:hypothetical protein
MPGRAERAARVPSSLVPATVGCELGRHEGQQSLVHRM